MEKEEKIKEVYGKFYDAYHINENGWFDNTDGRFSDLQLQELESCDYRASNIFRPKSLKGIEDNNGWIKIEDLNDTPILWDKKYLVFANGKEKETTFNPSQIKAGWEFGEITHYRIVDKFSAPIY